MVVQNAFQILLTGEYTKGSIFYEEVIIVYINPGVGHCDRDLWYLDLQLPVQSVP
jgi:hypothetical protein